MLSKQLARVLRLSFTAVMGISAVIAEDATPTGLTSKPFAARSGPRGTTLFTTLDAERTGVKAFNSYDDPEMWGRLFHEFNAGAIGTGVAVGDFDGDGKPDVFVVCKTGANHLFRNLGDFRFEDVTDHAGVAGPTGAWKQGAAFADVNNDGRLDLYVCRFGAPNLLYINQGDGTFHEEAAARGLALVDASNMAAFCDYDRDGWLDVYVQTNALDIAAHPDGQRDHLYHNEHDGHFVEVTRAAGIAGETRGHSATWWDYDEDGWPDLYVANDFAQPDQLYHNNRNGTFTDLLSLVVPHTPHFSMGADIGDLNNDGHSDLLVADMAASTRYMDNRGMATLRSALPEDLLHPKAAPQYMHSALFLGTGTGRMLEAACLAGLHATDWTFGVRFEDLDLDGRLDVYFTNGMAREFNNSDLVQRTMDATSIAERIRVMKDSPVLAQHHFAFRNLGDLQFENVSASWGLDHLGVGFGAAFADFDGDGDLDLVFSSYEGEVTLCRNDIAIGHSVALDLQGTISNRFGVGAAVKIETASGAQTRTLTLARGYLSTSEPTVHFGVGNDTVIRQLTIEWPSGRRQVFQNLAADRHYTATEPADAAIAAPVAPPIPLFAEASGAANLNVPNHERPENEPLQPLIPFRFNRPGPALACADFDGDGADDFAMGGVSGEAGHLFSNLGGGSFIMYGSKAFGESVSVADGPILALDVDADGDMDLVITKAGVAAPADSAEYQPRVLINDGRGSFAPSTASLFPALPISVGAAAAADFEHSGHLGFFFGGRISPGRYPQSPRSVLLAWRETRYVDVTAEFAPSLANRGMVTAALWTDVDRDGWVDLLVAYDWGLVACYRNIDGKGLEDVTEQLGFATAGNGWWSSLAAADFNGDGQLDYVVGNVGLNTRYHASETEPAVLHGDVKIAGAPPLIVEAQAEGGQWFTLRPRDTLVRAIPSLGRRFPTAESFARAKLENVFPAPVLAAAKKLTATELRSGVFISQPNGTYRFSALPRLAQIAPVRGLAAGDFDGDGHTDILFVGNSYAPIPETGRFDGGIGWLLRGDGKGAFIATPADESGFVVPGDARALAVGDLDRDGWPDAFVTRNNDRAMTYFNRGRPGHHSFGVSLKGASGNPTAIGSGLTLHLADGSTQTAEIAAGSGYFSQSSATVFFGYTESALPKNLEIRWPDGRKTEHVFSTPPNAPLQLSQP